MFVHRVLSVLAVSRSFGDIMFKNTSMESLSGDTDIWNSDSQVISKPEVMACAKILRICTLTYVG